MPKNTSFEVKIAVTNLENGDKFIINQTNFRNYLPLTYFMRGTEEKKHVYVRVPLYSSASVCVNYTCKLRW